MPNILDENYDNLVDMISEALYNDKPTLAIENTGIGYYEYWGATGFDAGQDIPYVEDEIIELPVKLPFSQRLICYMVNYFNNGGLFSSYYTDLLKYETVHVNYSVIKALPMADGIKFVIQFGEVE